MLQTNLIKLDALLPNYNLSSLGGKAMGLSVITALSLPCPPTWVVTAGLFTAFKDKVQPLVNSGTVIESLADLAEQFIVSEIGADLNELPVLKYAVRSSATIEDAASQSFAGMFESILDVAPERLSLAIAQVWLSGCSDRVIAYYGESVKHGTNGIIQNMELSLWPDMAVVLQPMVDAVYAGVCFSCHPSPQDTRDASGALVEIVSGAGERLVQGEVTPLALTGSFMEIATCLDRPWMHELVAAVTGLEEYTGGPVDIEFAVDKEEKLWLLQQRPVTVISDSDVLLLNGYRKAYKRTLCSLDIEFLIDGCSRYLAPYLELALDLTRWMVMTTNETDGQQELWVHDHLDDAVINSISDRIHRDSDYMARLAHRYDRQHRQILTCQRLSWAQEVLPLEDRLRDFFEFVVPLNAHYYAPMHIIEALSSLLLKKMEKTDQVAAEDDFFALTTGQVTTLGHIFAGRCRDLKEQITRNLKDIPKEYENLPVRWQQAVDELAGSFGFLNCHLPYEPPYDSREVYGFIKEDAHEAPEQDIQDQKTSLAERKYDVIPGWTELLTMLREWLNRRNQQMEYLYFVYAKAGPLLKAVGEKAGLNIEAVWRSDRAALLRSMAADQVQVAKQVVGKSGRDVAKYNHSRLCLYHDGNKVCLRDDVRPIYNNPSHDGIQFLKGRTVFGSGQLEGVVRIAFTPEELSEAESGEKNLIVVTGMTTPDFVPVLMKNAAVLITDEGGILCHASIIAREIRLPCIVGTGLATEKLTDGARVIVDLDRGIIRESTS